MPWFPQQTTGEKSQICTGPQPLQDCSCTHTTIIPFNSQPTVTDSHFKNSSPQGSCTLREVCMTYACMWQVLKDKSVLLNQLCCRGHTLHLQNQEKLLSSSVSWELSQAQVHIVNRWHFMLKTWFLMTWMKFSKLLLLAIRSFLPCSGV
jgi:hypothetical protein